MCVVVAAAPAKAESMRDGAVVLLLEPRGMLLSRKEGRVQALGWGGVNAHAQNWSLVPAASVASGVKAHGAKAGLCLAAPQGTLVRSNGTRRVHAGRAGDNVVGNMRRAWESVGTGSI